jgi:hypothetical protein
LEVVDCDIVHFDSKVDDVVVHAVGVFEYWFNDQRCARDQFRMFAKVSQEILKCREVLIFEAVGRDRTSTEGGIASRA